MSSPSQDDGRNNPGHTPPHPTVERLGKLSRGSCHRQPFRAEVPAGCPLGLFSLRAFKISEILKSQEGNRDDEVTVESC